MKTLLNDSPINNRTISDQFLPNSIIPTDLREWLDPRELVGYVVEAAQALYRATQIRENSKANSDGHAPVLLSVLTYCYATGTLATADVAQRMKSDPVVRGLCRNSPGDHRTLILFRGHHSVMVKLCFARAARKSWQARAYEADLSPAVRPEFEIRFQKYAFEEAGTRLRRAVELDFRTVPLSTRPATPQPKAAVA